MESEQEQEQDESSRSRKVSNMKEAKRQILFALPMIVTNVSYYCIPLVSVMFAGHLGEVELAASNLANSWATVTGFAFMVGLSGALETLCGQGYGAKLYRMLGIYLQASCIISIFFAIIISIIWIFTEPILILIHQDPQISKEAATYIRFLIPGLFAYGFIHNILRFLQTQTVIVPLVICSVVPLLIHIGIAYALVHATALGFEGAALAASISLWLSAILLGFYLLFAKKFNDTWKGFSLESLYHVLSNLKLALPSAAMVCLEYWAFEILVIMAGLMKNSAITTSLIAMCVNTEAIAFNFTFGLSAAASTRVSNELGANRVNIAKKAMIVTLLLSLILSLVIVLALLFGHKAWASLFSDSPVIINKFGSMKFFLLMSIILDSIQGVLSGVARGCGWQHWAVCINLAMFYLIGMPIAAVLGFKFHLEAKGLWIGLLCGLGFQAVGMLLLMTLRKWSRIELRDDRTQ